MGWQRFFRRAKWDRERSAEIESYVVLENDRWTGLARVIGPTGNRPHVPALHSGGQSETASTKS